VEEVHVRGVQTSESCVSLKLCHEFFILIFFCSFAKFYNYATSCAPCTRTKAACKPFDTDRAYIKARAEAVWRSKARKTKQKTNTEWKVEVSRKLKKLSELRGLRKDVHRITVALEKLAGIEGQDSDEELLS